MSANRLCVLFYQIRIFTNTFTLTPYNGAEALVCTRTPKMFIASLQRTLTDNQKYFVLLGINLVKHVQHIIIVYTFIYTCFKCCMPVVEMIPLFSLWSECHSSPLVSVFIHCFLLHSFGCSCRNLSHWTRWLNTTVWPLGLETVTLFHARSELIIPCSVASLLYLFEPFCYTIILQDKLTFIS